MRYHEFVDSVAQAAGQSSEQAQETVEIVLSTLAIRIPRTERENLAAQLPNELKAYMRLSEQTDRFDGEEFYNRISARLAVKPRRAQELVRVVGSVLRAAVSPGQIEVVRSALPAEYGHIFT